MMEKYLVKNICTSVLYNSPVGWAHWTPVGDNANENLPEEISYTVTDDYKIYPSFYLWFHS